ncbi:DUF412 domain-containing protein [Thalassomonas viridans]|uniref:UPF0208 membrane protein YfbV n=1 Tax=Thalassomonas viridans TaxID=137584 RepID=A0AAF0CCX9_9GAMM|nr:terminus macrodomain insulation protein YfbV [Thalassomonas viridans]WDE07664.1 DUF412 domain-containing protein [Thalassomonas viridans]
MNMSVVEIIKLGQRYMKLWPERAELGQYFADYRAIQVGRFVYRHFPALAVTSVVLQVYFGSLELLPQALVYGLFIASIPVQALVMLGVKADKHLPPSLATWYREGVARFNEQGGKIKLSVHKPRYVDLAGLLNLTYQHKSQ